MEGLTAADKFSHNSSPTLLIFVVVKIYMYVCFVFYVLEDQKSASAAL